MKTRLLIIIVISISILISFLMIDYTLDYHTKKSYPPPGIGDLIKEQRTDIVTTHPFSYTEDNSVIPDEPRMNLAKDYLPLNFTIKFNP